MRISAGWYEDPWNQADLRWWDGQNWTDQTAATSCADAEVGACTPSVRTGIEHLIGRAGRIAIIDVETTGLYNTDRIVEIAILTLDCDGRVHDEFETLVQPLRDVGPTWMHGVDAGMVREAPTFSTVAHHVASRLDGAVVVGHNVGFDTRMIGNELSKAGIDIDWGLCLDTLRATGCKLSQACADRGIPLDNAHRAIADARATARLLFATCDRYVDACTPAIARPLHCTPLRVRAREGHIEVLPPAPYLAALARGIHTNTDVAPYVQLLDVAIADLRLSPDERNSLRDLAGELGLDDRGVARAHREFMNGLIDAALEDQIVTDAECDQLCRAAALLDVDVESVMTRIDPYRAAFDELRLVEGMTVCFTGQGEQDGCVVDRASQERMAQEHGLVVAKSVTKKGPDLVVAADGDSRSAKARRARQLGIAICTFSDFASALESGEPVTFARVASSGIADVCVTCGSSWMAPRQSVGSECADCSRSALRGSDRMNRRTSRIDKGSGDSAASVVVVLVCTDCGAEWERTRVRGRRPALCPGCVAKDKAV